MDLILNDTSILNSYEGIALLEKHLIYLSCSPDGKKIAFQSDREVDVQICVTDIDGKELKKVRYDSKTENLCPSWSPDGKKIVLCSRDRDANFEIYVMNANGSEEIKVSFFF